MRRRPLLVLTMSTLLVGSQFSGARAVTVGAQVASGIVFYSQSGSTAKASPTADGTDTTIRLEAGAATGIESLTFAYSTDGTTFTTIATVGRNDNGAFSYEWTSPFPVGATGVTLRANGTNAGGTPFTAIRTGVTVDRAGGTNATVNLSSGDQLGYFAQAYQAPNDATLVRAAGTTSATSGSVAVARFDGTGAAVGSTPAPVIPSGGAANTGTFKVPLAIDGYPFAAPGGTDQLVVGASRDTDDVESYQLYPQRILGGQVNAVADRNRVNGNATVTVTVLDSRGAPIVGAQVYQAPSGGTAVTGAPQYTDADGRATFAQGMGSFYYFANAANDTTFNTPQDVRSGDVVVASYTPMPTTITATSADGQIFDFDEYATGDVVAHVKDQEGQPYGYTSNPSGQIDYYWVLTPFDGAPATVRYPASGTDAAAVDPDGDAVIAFPTAGSREGGTYQLFAGLSTTSGGLFPTRTVVLAPSQVLSVKAGEAKVDYAAASPEQVLAGTSVVVQGRFVLEDGVSGLPGRTLGLRYQRGGESGGTAGDAYLVVPGGGPNTLGAPATTDSSGAFTATIKDPAESPQPAETGGTLDVSVPMPNQDATTNDHGVDFLVSLSSGTLSLDPTTPLDSTHGATPGRPVDGRVVVKNADGTPLANQPVALSLDHGFFTPYAATTADLTPDPAPANGADAGSYKSLGPSITVRTDNAGAARFTAAIGRDGGFDDDGTVQAQLTATAGRLTRSEPIDWTSSDPLNGGSLTLAPAPAALQDSSILPRAPLDDQVRLNVRVTDQFGNTVGGENVTLSDDTATGSVTPTTVVSDFIDDVDATASSTAVQVQNITASWTTETSTYQSLLLGPPSVVTGSETLTGRYAVNWYEVDYDSSTYTLVHDTADRVRAGTAVKVSYQAIDQFGEPISNLYVQILRSGPGTEGSSQAAAQGLLGQDGRLDYTFMGGHSGAALISTMVHIGSDSGTRLPSAERTDRVDFVDKATIHPAITARNAGSHGADRVSVRASRADGAVVRLYVVRSDGNHHTTATLIRTAHLDGRGMKTWTIPDTRPRSKTRYGAVVDETGDTQQAITDVVGIR